MNLFIQHQSPLGLREQVKRQIRVQIETGELQAGDPLPSAKDLSAMLNINRNTITQAYKELSADGLLDVIVGSGTFVREGLTLQKCNDLRRVFQQAFQQALNLGYSESEIADFFLNQLTIHSGKTPPQNILVVDCNHEVIDHICRWLEGEFQVRTQGVLIQELEQNAAGARDMLIGKDLIICGFNHVQEFHHAVPENDREMLAVLFTVDVKALNVILNLPKGTVVGYVCANQRSTETFYNSSYFSGDKELRRILAGLDNPEGLSRVLDQCELIFATIFIFDRVCELARKNQKVIRVGIDLDQSSMALIRLKLGRRKLSRKSG